jgi:hypothetical protein
VQATTVTSSGHVSANGNVSAGGTVIAFQNLGVGGNANVEGDMRIAGAVGAATVNATGSVNAPTVNAGVLNADAVLHVPGSVVGGARRFTYSILGLFSCTAWGDGQCQMTSGSTSPEWSYDCAGGAHPTGYVRGVVREMGEDLILCIQP